MDEFLRNLQKSNLLTPEQWQIVRRELAKSGDQLAAKLAQFLVERTFVTRWQADKLLDGKKNFTIGKYRLLDCIGTGGMGAVFKALHRDLGRTVAIKIMSPGVVKNREAVARFRHEMQVVAALDDPHIVAAYDAGSDGGVHFLVMEYVEGRDLGELIKQPGRLPVEWATECIRQTAQGLQYAHDQGMVHRDIKPTNLLVARERDSDRPLVKILDLGLARFVSELAPAGLATGEQMGTDGSLTQVGQFLGTPDYISPEQANDTRTADIRSDIFSLGCTFYRILTGELPFSGETVLEKLDARERSDARKIRTVRSDVPAELEAVIARMLARDPRDRYQTPREVAEALAPFALRSGTKGSLLPPGDATLRRAPRNKGEDTRLEQILRSLAECETDQPLSVATVLGRLKRLSPRAWIAGGAALVVAVAAFFAWQRLSEVTLVIDWPLDQREGASLTVAQRPVRLPKRETIAIHGRPGTWDIRLRREGYEPVDEEVSLHSGGEVRFTPQWQPTAATSRRAGLEALELLVRAAAGTSPSSKQATVARARLGEFLARYPAGRETRAALELISRLPWPLDLLDGSAVPADEGVRFAASAGDSRAALVGVFGDSRLTFWNSVTAIAASSDGRHLAGASSDGTVRVFDLPQGRALHLIVPPVLPTELAFQPTGPLLAIAGTTGPVTIWNAADGRLTATLADTNAPVAFSPDGKLLAVRAARQEIALFDADTGELRRTMLGHSTGVLQGMTFSHNGKMLASFGTDASVVLWDVASGQERRRFPNAQLPLFSPDDAYLAAGTPRGDLTLWDTRTGETQRTLDEGGYPLAFGPSGQTIVSKRLGRAIVWNLATGNEVRTLVEVPELAVVSPDGSWLAGGDDAVGELRIWNLASGGLPRQVATAGPVSALAFSRDSSTIISGSRDGVLQMFSPDPPAERGTPGRLLKAADLSPDEMLLAARVGGQVELLDVSTGSAGRTLANDTADIDWLSFSPDGQLLAGFGGWGFFKLSLRLWDPVSATESELGEHRSGTVRTMAWSTDSRWLATAGDSRLVTIWDVARRTAHDTLDDFSDRVTALAFHPDGRHLAVACQDQTLVIWDLKAESARSLATGGGPYQQVSFSRDGSLLAAPAGERVLIWDTETGKLVSELSTGGGVAQGPVFDALGKALVAAGDDGVVWLWNHPGQDRYRFDPDQTIRVGPVHGLVRRVLWAPEGRHLVTLNGNGTVYVLRLVDRKSP